MKYYIGIDLGGTNIAAGIVSENKNIILKKNIPTNAIRSADEISDDIASLIKNLITESKVEKTDIQCVGIGTPGSVDFDNGTVIAAHNLGFFNVPLKKLIEQKTGYKCFIDNDANAAIYGELIAGKAKGLKNVVMITIGTGIGGGIIIDEKIIRGANNCAAEIGHMVIKNGGNKCSCGKKGCFEAYCSATALVKLTIKYMKKNPDSVLWELCENNLKKVNGKIFFKALRMNDATARAVFEIFTDDLSCGIINLIDIFEPEMLLVGGGISNEKDDLILPLREKVLKGTFVKNHDKQIISAAILGNDAGIIGASMLGIK